MEQYAFIKIEIEDISKRIARGYSTSENMRRLKKSLAELDDVKTKIEADIYSIDSSFMRSLLRFKFIDGLSWSETAKKFGEGYTPDMLRKAYQRFVKKEG